jgi:hypothetical protein
MVFEIYAAKTTGGFMNSQDLEIKAALTERGEDSSGIELRDLKRYYSLLNYHLLELTLCPSEVHLVCDALKDYRVEDDSEQARVIWKQVAAAIQRDQLDQKWKIDGSALIHKLQALNHLQFMALVDAVERFWIREKSNLHESKETKLSRIGLIKCCDSAL